MSDNKNSISAMLDDIVPKPNDGSRKAIMIVNGTPMIVYLCPDTVVYIPAPIDYTQQVETTSSAELATTSSTTDTSVKNEASPAIGAGDDGEKSNSSVPTLEETLSSKEQAIKQLFDEQNRLRKQQESTYQEFINLKQSVGKSKPETLKKWKESIDLADKWVEVIEELIPMLDEDFNLNAAVCKWYPEVQKFKTKDFLECFKKCEDRYNVNKKYYEASMVHEKSKNTTSTKTAKSQDIVPPKGPYLQAVIKQPVVDADTSKPVKGRWRKAVESNK